MSLRDSHCGAAAMLRRTIVQFIVLAVGVMLLLNR